MASPQELSPHDEEMRLKQAERDRKMKLKEIKRTEKQRKKEEKRQKKNEKRRRKLAKKGIYLSETPPSPGAAPRPEAKKIPEKQKIDENLPEAEVISGEADVWVPKSARNIDEIQKRIDRMDQRTIHNLKERYKKRYGEDLEIPDAYNIEPSIDLETAEKSGVIESSEETSKETSTGLLSQSVEGSSEVDKKESGFRLGGLGSKGKKKEKSKVKIDRPVRFFDLRTIFFFRKKYIKENTGGGKKAILTIIDIIVLVLFPLTIIRLLTTPFIMRRDRKDAELIQEMNEQSSSVQTPT